MMGDTEMETTPRFSCMERSSEFTREQFWELRKNFSVDANPKEKTLEALTDALKLTKGDIRFWFYQKQCEMMLKRFPKGHKYRKMYCRPCI